MVLSLARLDHVGSLRARSMSYLEQFRMEIFLAGSKGAAGHRGADSSVWLKELTDSMGAPGAM